MRHYKIRFKTEVQGIRTVSAQVLADNEAHAKRLFSEKHYERYLVTEQVLVESPIEDSFEIVEDTGAFDVV
jgi:hypothetical protein